MTIAAPRRVKFAAFAIALMVSAPMVHATVFPMFNQSVAEFAAADEAIGAFYRDRDYAPLWTGDDAAERRAAFLRALTQADAHGLPASRYRPEELASRFRAARGEREIGRLEVETTRLFLSFAQDIQSGALEPRELMPAEIKRELPRRDRLELLNAFAASDNPGVYLRELAPRSAHYARLMREKARMERLVAQGGWGARVQANSLEPGDAGESVIALRNRLIRMGYLDRSVASSYDAAMVAAVRAFQASHGLTPTGVANPATLIEVNASAEDRLKQVIVALERERWMNYEEGLGQRHVWVNLVDFHARVVDDGKVSFETRSVVGETVPEHQTYEFSDTMEYMEVNPDWTVPRSIIGREYLPRLRNNPNAAGHLQIIDRRGRVVPRGAVDWSRYSARNFPFTMRQPPGRSNALGVVKFMFPNPYAIYLHDTPSKSLFDREQRAYSHGCIRLSDPRDFAYHLLARQMDDPQSYFDSLVSSGQQTRVPLEQPIPVHLVYFTAFSGADGQMQFRRDIYNRDARLFQALLEAGVAFPGAEG